LNPSPARGHALRVSEREAKGAWLRLVIALLLATIGGVGFWAIVVALPAVESSFAVSRADASLTYTATMIGYAAGGIVMGRIADRFGITWPLAGGTLALGLGYIASGVAPNIAALIAAQGLLVGVGSAATYAPLIADVSQSFTRRRGIAIAISASGNTIAGTIWPTLLQHFFDTVGWRRTLIGLGVFCLVAMPPLILALRRHAPLPRGGGATAAPAGGRMTALGLARGRLQLLLVVAGLCCCVAMSVPQVHLVAYCRDLGYGADRGAEMLSLMLGANLVTRIAFGWSADRIGGLATLLLGSVMQAASLLLYAFFNSLAALFAISALFGLVQSGVIPSYQVIVREYFPAREAATRMALIAVANFAGMSLGGWIAGGLFDLTGSYRAAFFDGVLWNAVNAAIVMWLLLRSLRRPAFA
jgi:MFS family permease